MQSGAQSGVQPKHKRRRYLPSNTIGNRIKNRRGWNWGVESVAAWCLGQMALSAGAACRMQRTAVLAA